MQIAGRHAKERVRRHLKILLDSILRLRLNNGFPREWYKVVPDFGMEMRGYLTGAGLQSDDCPAHLARGVDECWMPATWLLGTSWER